MVHCTPEQFHCLLFFFFIFEGSSRIKKNVIVDLKEIFI